MAIGGRLLTDVVDKAGIESDIDDVEDAAPLVEVITMVVGTVVTAVDVGRGTDVDVAEASVGDSDGGGGGVS